MITPHRVDWIIWIGQIVEILGIIIHKQICLDCDTQQRVGVRIISDGLQEKTRLNIFACIVI